MISTARVVSPASVFRTALGARVFHRAPVSTRCASCGQVLYWYGHRHWGVVGQRIVWTDGYRDLCYRCARAAVTTR